jgi:hypothetical protein
MDLTVAVGQPPRGDLGARDRQLEDDDRQHQPGGFGQLQRIEHVATVESPQQSDDKRAGRRSAHELEPIAIDEARRI